jgi:hypothetical protein
MDRELTLVDVHHPEFIGNDWQRVDHPTVAPLADGAPDLGWEGDSRLAVYLCKPTQQFVLWRLENDGEYRPVAQLPSGAAITPDSVNRLIRRLVEIDQRRGFDPYLDVITSIEKAEKDQAQAQQERIVQVADKLLFGLSRSHLPGIDVSYKHNLLGRAS